MAKQKPVLYDGVFPAGVSLGAVATLNGTNEIVVNANHPNKSTNFEFITRPFEKFAAQLEISARDHTVELGCPQYGDHTWVFHKPSAAFGAMDGETWQEWPANAKITELRSIPGEAKIFRADRKRVREHNIRPGMIVHGNSEALSRWGGHYIEQSSLWLVNGQLRIVHTTAKNDEITSGISVGPSGQTKRYIEHFFPQAKPA